MSDFKTTIIIPTYPDDPHQKTAYDHLIKLGYNNIIITDSRIKRTFAENNNNGAKESMTKYLLFLNSDTLPEQGFLEKMEDVLDRNPHIGVVGATIYYVEDVLKKFKFKGSIHTQSAKKNTLQHTGIAFNKQLLPFEIGRGEDINSVELLQSKAVGAVTGACMLVRKDEFLSLGGFDENFKNGWEDTDLCLRYLDEKLLLSYYCADARVGHFYSGGSEHGRYDNEDANFDLWFSKWHNTGKIYSLIYRIPSDVDKIDLGCGKVKKDGFYGIDKFFSKDVDLQFDLEDISNEDNIRLPFGVSTISELYCSHVLEHLDNMIDVMNEIHRIVKPDGWVYITVPHAISWAGFASPFHKRYFTPETFINYFGSTSQELLKQQDPEMDLIKPWHIEKLEYTLVPEGVDPWGLQREITVKMRPLKQI